MTANVYVGAVRNTYHPIKIKMGKFQAKENSVHDDK